MEIVELSQTRVWWITMRELSIFLPQLVTKYYLKYEYEKMHCGRRSSIER